MRQKKFKTVRDRLSEAMFRVKWPDGELSADCYNSTWVKEHVRRLEETERRSQFK